MSGLAQQQRAVLSLLKNRTCELPEDEWLSRISQSRELMMLREIARWWRQYQVGSQCRFMTRLLKQSGQSAPKSQPILEVNPEHALLKRLGGEAGDERFGDLANILFDQATLAEGGQLEDPAAYVARVTKLLSA